MPAMNCMRPLLTLLTLAAAGAAGPFADVRPARRGPAMRLQPSGASFTQEKHLRNVRQLTYGGQNAEAYFPPMTAR